MTGQKQTTPDEGERTDASTEEKTRDIEEIRDIIRDEVDDLEEENDQLREQAESLEEELEKRAEIQKDILAKIHDLEQRLDGELQDDVERGADPEVDRETPLEDILALPNDVANQELSANVRRAREIVASADTWGRGVPAGVQLTAGQIGRALNVGLDVDAHPETVRRIISILDELGKEHVTRRRRDAEKRIILDEELVERLQRLASHRGEP